MSDIKFDFPIYETDKGLMGVGGEINSKNLFNAYKIGMFPWPVSENDPNLWSSPDPRGVLFCSEFRVNRTLSKFLKKTEFEVTFNKDFHRVISFCKNNPNRDEDTWITNELQVGYEKFHQEGNAYSLEVWDKNQLVGGLYGVKINNFYSAESMFYLKPNASKFAIYHLIQHLNESQIKWLDIQMVSPTLEEMGGREISRPKFLELLSKSI